MLVLVPLGGGAADRAGDAGRAPAGPGELGDAGRHVPVERAGDDGRDGLGVVVHPVGKHAARAVDGAAEHGAALEDDPLGADSGPVALVIPRRLEFGALGAEGPDEQRLDRDRAPRIAVGSE